MHALSPANHLYDPDEHANQPFNISGITPSVTSIIYLHNDYVIVRTVVSAFRVTWNAKNKLDKLTVVCNNIIHVSGSQTRSDVSVETESYSQTPCFSYPKSWEQCA